MASRSARTPDLPFRGQPGRCPHCGTEVCPRPEAIFPVGLWDGRDAAGSPTGGVVFGTNCPECGVVLLAHGGGRWNAAGSSAVAWHTGGCRRLVGGDRWRGRLGAWSPEDAPRHEARLRELVDRLGSLEEAVLTLHGSAGLGALHLTGLVERVAGVSKVEAQRVVVRALDPDRDR